MFKGKTTDIVQLGATGPVAELFRKSVVQPGIGFRLEAIATANHPELEGKSLGETALGGPPELAEVPIIGMEDAVNNTDATVVFSGLQSKVAAEYEDRFAKDRLVPTNASANRGRPDVPVVNAFVNGHHIDELYQRQNIGGRIAGIIAGGNSMSGILAVPLVALHREIGVRGVHVETMQGWSGAGLSEVPSEIPTDSDDIADQIVPITSDEWEKVITEPKMFLGTSMDEPADINITAKVNRGPWVKGHHARIVARLARETSKHEVEDIWRHFKVTNVLESVRSEVKALSQGEGESWPGRHQPIKPVKLAYHDLVRYDTTQIQLARIHPMRANAHLQEIDQGNPQWITFEVSGHNLILGAVGVNLLNVIYARAKGYLSEQG